MPSTPGWPGSLRRARSALSTSMTGWPTRTANFMRAWPTPIICIWRSRDIRCGRMRSHRCSRNGSALASRPTPRRLRRATPARWWLIEALAAPARGPHERRGPRNACSAQFPIHTCRIRSSADSPSVLPENLRCLQRYCNAHMLRYDAHGVLRSRSPGRHLSPVGIRVFRTHELSKRAHLLPHCRLTRNAFRVELNGHGFGGQTVQMHLCLELELAAVSGDFDLAEPHAVPVT